MWCDRAAVPALTKYFLQNSNTKLVAINSLTLSHAIFYLSLNLHFWHSPNWNFIRKTASHCDNTSTRNYINMYVFVYLDMYVHLRVYCAVSLIWGALILSYRCRLGSHYDDGVDDDDVIIVKIVRKICWHDKLTVEKLFGVAQRAQYEISVGSAGFLYGNK